MRPIHDSQGQVVGIVGVDLTVDKYLARLAAMRRAAVTGLMLTVFLALLTGISVSFAQSRVLQAATALSQAHDELEERVAERTSELAEANYRLNQAYTATIGGWSKALDLRDQETQGHSERVTAMTLRLARSIGLTQGELTDIERGALLHDIGKMGVPDHILRKPGPLTEAEWEVMRLHPVHAHELLSPITFLRWRSRFATMRNGTAPVTRQALKGKTSRLPPVSLPLWMSGMPCARTDLIAKPGRRRVL